MSAVMDFTPWRFSGSFAVALAAVVTAFAVFWLLTDHQSLLAGPPVIPPAPPSPEPADPAPAATPGGNSGADVVPATPAPVLRPAEIERLQRRLKKLLTSDQVHLDAELSLQALADHAETTRHKMSAAIREIYGLTFYQLMARERVREAARRLQAKSGANRTIADIAFSVGFNTLSAFNAAFKAEFGVTPSQFRERAMIFLKNAASEKPQPIRTLEKVD